MDFWHFAGSYWWLIFPVMAMSGGIVRGLQRGQERRHTRRLEIIKAKGEVRTAQLAARASSHAAPGPAVAVDPTAEETPQARLERLFTAHDAVTKRWLDYELDVAKLIAYPAMSDGRQPLTAAFLRAKQEADSLRPASAKAKLSAAALAEYRKAVNDYEVAFDVAERDARRVKDSTFTDTERKRLEVAKQLLTVAIDQAATPAERQVAYRRVREELDGLISLSDGAIEVLESKVALELTTGHDTTRPVTDAAASAPPRPVAEPPATAPGPEREAWPVPARDTNTAPGRVVRPKPRA